MHFSSRIDPDLAPNPFSSAMDHAKTDHGMLIDLTQSNPTLAGFDYPKDEIATLFSEASRAAYHPDPRGLASARRAVAAYYRERQISVDPENIVLAAGTSEAYAFLFKLLCEPGDSILCPKPGYPLVPLIAEMEGIRACAYPLSGPEWRWQAASLLECLIPKTRAVVAVSPNNPTGSMLTTRELRDLNRFCGEQVCALIVDEVFLDYPSPSRMRTVVSAAGNTEALTFTLGGLSKCCGLPQMKLAWIVVSGPAVETASALERLEFIADAFLSVGTPVLEAASGLLELGKPVRKQIRSRVDRNEAVLRELVRKNQNRVTVHTRDGGWYAMIGLLPECDDEDFALSLLETRDVLVQPGFLFDLDDPTVVVSLLTPEQEFRTGIERLLDLAANPPF